MAQNKGSGNEDSRSRNGDRNKGGALNGGKRNHRKAARKQSWESYQSGQIQVNRNYSDSLFRMLFNNKKALLELYNAFNSSSYQNEDGLEITTIQDVIYMGMKNDVSFLIGCYMNLYEAQTTKNPNMPLRGLFYFASLYRSYVKKNNLNLYSSRQLSLPTPRYIVLYTGPAEEPEQRIYRLTDSFADKENACLECTAVVLNVNTGHNAEITKQCRLLYEYTCFLATARQCIQDSGKSKAEAIDEAVTQCINRGILADFLTKHRAEVIEMCITEYDLDAHMKATYEEGREDGKADGKAEEQLHGIQAVISTSRRYHASRKDVMEDLVKEYLLTEMEANSYLDLYWK